MADEIIPSTDDIIHHEKEPWSNSKSSNHVNQYEILDDTEDDTHGGKLATTEISPLLIKDIKWNIVMFLTAVYLGGLYTVLTFPYIQRWKTFLWTMVLLHYSGLGITVGAHRFWTHRTFKGNTIFKMISLVGFYITGSNSIYQWVRDHRVHHKFSETHADPHDSRRGFFFSHVGWLMVKKHPDVIEQGKKIDISDLENDPLAAFFTRHVKILGVLLCYAIPTLVPMYFWNEDFYHAFMSQIARQMYIYNCTFCINSFAHLYGMKPYDRNIEPGENKWISILFTYGEGWHNYHHTFPWDYKAAEYFGGRSNLSALVIDFFAKIGWVYDLKEPPPSLVEKVLKSRGDGSHNSNYLKLQSSKFL